MNNNDECKTDMCPSEEIEDHLELLSQGFSQRQKIRKTGKSAVLLYTSKTFCDIYP
jgi:hypothetical protein